MAVDFTATYKVLVIGDVNVGKTCLVHRFCDERFYDTYISTVGIDFKQKIVNLDGVPIKLQIWDTAGEERFRTLTTAYYRGAQGIVLVYDVTNLDSFNHLSYWLRNIEENASPEVVKVLAGNKCELAESFDMPFYEVSCRGDVNVQDTFLTLARLIRDLRQRRASLFEERERQSDGVKLDAEQKAENSTSACGSC
ncbi:Ras-related protein Rab-8B [Penaeus vannamei]|uniref:Ras-related protein Rab-8B n=1 Tax=Penaeus vannamei TaxID=6689 RepID=A0A423SWZ2_PENVA|nr:Ras-related protein Rab-8B [Penaeus vannamei]